jgi:hypothetical protein
VQGNTFMLPPPNLHVQNPQNLGTAVFNAAPPLAINPDDSTKAPTSDLTKMKQDEQQKSMQQQQQQMAGARTIVTNINQPPPNLQQFIVNANSWPHTQQFQQMPMNSQIQIVTQQPSQAIRNGNEVVIQNTIPVSQASAAQGQHVITAFNPQQIQFSNAPIITQPPPITIQSLMDQHQQQQQQQVTMMLPQQQQSQQQIQRTNAPLSYQQHFEQKINVSNASIQHRLKGGNGSNNSLSSLQMMSESQQRAMKRKIDDAEADSNKSSFAKSGMG